MEVIMKKIAFIVIMSFVLLTVSNTILAKTDTDYDNALKYYNSGKYKEAVRIFKEYIKKKPEPSAYYRIGYALYELRKFSEANEYFKQAYLIDPNFSPELVAPAGKSPEEAAKIAGKHVPSKKKPPVPVQTEKQQETKPEPFPEKQVTGELQAQKPHEPLVTPKQKSAAPELPKVAPQATQPPAGLPRFPLSKDFMPEAAPGILTGLVAGFGMILLVLGIAFYVFFCLCFFIIAKKLDIPSPWIAFVPIIQIWTFVRCAGKPWWWILLLLIPLINIILIIYLYMCIAENLGKNKWLGLIVLIPYIGALILLGLLAFSKSEKPGRAIESTTPA